MRKNYTLPKYDEQREWISKARNQMNFSWERIYYGGGTSEEDLVNFLNLQKMNFWDVDIEDWANLVRLEKDGEERLQRISDAEKNSIIGDGETVNDIVIPIGKRSCWQKYRRHLLDDQHFLYEDVKAIENSSFRILKRLNADTKGTAVKGLVVGNVQSGKTANMAALMAMAADYGWNMFIVLSGTIENLRIQTLERLVSDLNLPGCNLTWQGIAHPSKKCAIVDKAQNLNFEQNNPNRYLTVCLKNSTRLKNLVEWLHEDKKSAQQMKILVIDDEADQAGVNTKDVDEEERTKINELVVNLVGNNNADGSKSNDCFAAMNYIGYTATPYANVLNEASEASLYPKDFISTLQVSKNYFGPQQIFGDRNNDAYKGLSIIRTITADELCCVKEIHNGESNDCPTELENALCWFLCCVAMMRKYEFKKPLSMLIHTSQMTKHHFKMNGVIRRWFDGSVDSIIEKCKCVWQKETEEFTKADLFEDYPEFATDPEQIKEYLVFKEIKPFLVEMLQHGVQNIMLDEEGELSYNRGIHLCIDNAKSSGVKNDGTYVRLAYPKKELNLEYAPAFIVIGGATLSRGLTIEGLVSTYFLRSTKQGDTLMQMGRWFGYRKGYELLPRLWLTSNAQQQFEFLADLDSELRSYIAQMELFDRSPKEYAVVVKQAPSTSLLRISSKNKMQSAINTEMNYSGLHSQTHLFVEDELTLLENYKVAETFISSLGQGIKGKGNLGKTCYIWEKIEFDYLYEMLLSKYKFHTNNMAFSNLDALKSWIDSVTKEEKLSKWNVILFGLEKGEREIEFAGYSIKAITRTRKVIKEGTINIGVLTDPKEKVADVDYGALSNEGKIKYDKYRTDNAEFIRRDAGMETVPSLVIYVIDKDSKKTKKATKRYDLNAPCDIVGLSINIPGDRINENYAKSVMIDLKKYGLEPDIEGETNED